MLKFSIIAVLLAELANEVISLMQNADLVKKSVTL